MRFVASRAPSARTKPESIVRAFERFSCPAPFLSPRHWKKPSSHCRPRAVIGRAETADASLHRRDGALEGSHLVLLRLGRRDVVLREQPPDETPQARHDAPPGPVVRPAQTPRGLREYRSSVALARPFAPREPAPGRSVRTNHTTLTAFPNPRSKTREASASFVPRRDGDVPRGGLRGFPVEDHPGYPARARDADAEVQPRRGLPDIRRSVRLLQAVHRRFHRRRGALEPRPQRHRCELVRRVDPRRKAKPPVSVTSTTLCWRFSSS